MQASTSGTMQHLWLTLLVVFVFCVGMSNQLCLAESQQQPLELESCFVLGSSGDESTSGSMPGLFVKEFLSLSPSCGEALSIVGSDAYPGSILHGPPATNDIV
jgi:hypothetical protein